MPDMFKLNNRNIQSNDVPDVFNKYFLNVAHSLLTHSAKTQSPLNLLKNAYQTISQSMKVVPVITGEIMNIIGSLKSKKSSGYEESSSKILKLCVFISAPFSYICNMSISTGVFPERLKYVVVNPLYKSGDKADITNYRSISMLTVFSKSLEKVMHSRLTQYLQANNILVQEQFGFTKNLSTDHTTFSFTTGKCCCHICR
jgi:hypothetical protein